MRMEEQRFLRKILVWRPVRKRPRGKPRKRWIEDVEEDLRNMEIRWSRLYNERAECRQITGLYASRRRRYINID